MFYFINHVFPEPYLIEENRSHSVFSLLLNLLMSRQQSVIRVHDKLEIYKILTILKDYPILGLILKSLIIIIPVLISVAFFTLLERKIMASIQRRRGPNVVGIFGILQPFADGLKLLIKETIIPSKSNKIIFLIAPILALFLSFLN
jgi:hypothetical protein